MSFIKSGIRPDMGYGPESMDPGPAGRAQIQNLYCCLLSAWTWSPYCHWGLGCMSLRGGRSRFPPCREGMWSPTRLLSPCIILGTTGSPFSMESPPSLRDAKPPFAVQRPPLLRSAAWSPRCTHPCWCRCPQHPFCSPTLTVAHEPWMQPPCPCPLGRRSRNVC